MTLLPLLSLTLFHKSPVWNYPRVFGRIALRWREGESNDDGLPCSVFHAPIHVFYFSVLWASATWVSFWAWCVSCPISLFCLFCFWAGCSAFEAVTPLQVWRCWDWVLTEVTQSSEMFGKEVGSGGGGSPASIFFWRGCWWLLCELMFKGCSVIMLSSPPDTSPVSNEDPFP